MRNKKNNKIMMLILIIMFITVGYAAVFTTLKIDGSAVLSKNTWNVYWDVPVVTTGSVVNTLPTRSEDSGDPSNTKLTFTVTLNFPGDFYEFTVDAVNAGSLDAMVTDITNTTNTTLPSYVKYTVSYFDDIPIETYHLLPKADNSTNPSTPTKIKYKVRVEYDETVATTSTINTMSSDETYTFTFGVDYSQATSLAVEKPSMFVAGSWDAIIAQYKAGDPGGILESEMLANKQRPIQLDMDHDGTYEVNTYLMILNLETTEDCREEGFSQSACGFVLKFTNSLTSTVINPSNGSVPGTGNVGGWEASRIRAYLNGIKYRPGESAQVDYTGVGVIDGFPSDLKSKVIDTVVVSGYGINDSANFTTTDKLYLMDSRELYGTSFDVANSKARDLQKQYEYYRLIGVTTSNRLVVGHKNLSGSAVACWLRSASNANNYQFFMLDTNGSSTSGSGRYSQGILPAFRIAKQ